MPRPATVADVIRAVRELRDTAGGPDAVTRWVGLDGFGAAGKTTLAAAIAAALEVVDEVSPTQAVHSGVRIVHVDDFSSPSLAEWDWTRMQEQLVAPLLAGRPAHYQVWDWHADAGAGWKQVEPGSVVVIEGVSSTRAELRVPWDLTVWVETPRDVRLARALERDGEQMLPQWLEHWIPTELAYAGRERPQERVDLVVHGSA